MTTLLSIVVLALKDHHLLPLTLQSLSCQEEKNFEIVLLDRGGKGGEAKDCLIHIQAVKDLSLPAAMNLGLKLAKGDYVQYLFPGDRFLSQQATAYVQKLAEEARMPQIITASCLLRDPSAPPKAAAISLTLDALKKGLAPIRLHSCWFLKNRVLSAGGFDERSSYLPTFDLLCRLLLDRTLRSISTTRVLTDDEGRRFDVLGGAIETCKILYRRFGLWHAMRWIFFQDHVKMLRWSWKWIKEAFWKQ